MTVAAIHRLAVAGPWDRLHRAETDALAGLLTSDEFDAVRRRLGGGRPAPAWVPDSAGPTGSRFTEPHGPGALYLADELSVCVSEVLHHHALYCAASVGTPPGVRAVFRHLVFRVSGTLADASHDRRGGLHDPDSYTASWNFGRRARALGLEGVRYRSVRRRGGRCLAVFEERAIRFLRIEFGAVVIEWDGVGSHRIA